MTSYATRLAIVAAALVVGLGPALAEFEIQESTIDPGETVTIDVTNADKQQIDTLLKHVRRAFDEERNQYVRQAGQYDAGSFDPHEILSKMMYYDAIEGQAHTHLKNQYQGFIDASCQLAAGKAILMGRSEKPAAELLRDGEPLPRAELRHWTTYRFIFPVRPSSRETRR